MIRSIVRREIPFGYHLPTQNEHQVRRTLFAVENQTWRISERLIRRNERKTNQYVLLKFHTQFVK